MKRFFSYSVARMLLWLSILNLQNLIETGRAVTSRVAVFLVLDIGTGQTMARAEQQPVKGLQGVQPNPVRSTGKPVIDDQGMSSLELEAYQTL